MERPRWWPGPTALAALITLLNALKPAVVDDTAYLLFARHLTTHPLDPYGFELFWYRQPQPAMQVLLPPVLPYWLALGMTIAGENLFLLKLWLFPFLLLFCHSAAVLLRRVARGVERPALVLLAGSPFVLPLVNVMLDIPAVALGLAAVAVFLRACECRSWRLAAAAGVLAALAVQTKYTMIVLPAVLIWAGLLHRRTGLAILACGVAVAIGAGWELFLDHLYGTSHFLYHVRDQKTHQGLEAWLGGKSALGRPLLGFLGGLSGAWGLAAARGVGWPRWLVSATALAAVCGMVTVCSYPLTSLDLPAIVFYSFGAFVLTATAASALILAVRVPRGLAGWLRRNRLSWFLIGWLAIELGAYFVLTPFPAGRRVVAVCVVMAFLTARLLSRVQRVKKDRALPSWIIAFGLTAGLGLFALDWWDSLAEKDLVTSAVRIVRPAPTERVWTQGHWAWQYYADRAGWELVVPGRSHLRTGDWLVVPVPNTPSDFYRPHHGFATFDIPADAVEPVQELVWGDPFAARTIPNLYGGSVPVVGLEGPRLKVALYRVRRDWVPAQRR